MHTPRMDVDEYIVELREHGEQLAAAAEAAPLEGAVPTCPEWNMRDLVRHIGAVHRWATAFVQGRKEPWEVPLEEVVGRWPHDHELLEWFRQGHHRLVTSLEAADRALDCWTFLGAPSPLAMWARRQAHETAIHRSDAETACGRLPVFRPRFAADGIDELVSCFITRRRGRLRTDPPRTLRFRADDADRDWLLSIGPHGVDTTPGPGAADCTVAGPSSDLYLTVWNRRPAEGLGISGDSELLSLFLDRVHVRSA